MSLAAAALRCARLLATHLGDIDPQLVRIWPERAESYDVWLVMHADLNRSARVRAAADAADAIIASVAGQ